MQDDVNRRLLSWPEKSTGTGNKRVRPIRNKRDFDRSSVVAKQLAGKADSAAELRLQALLREMDRFEESAEELDCEGLEDYGYAGPHRRWSDDAPPA